MSDENLGGIKDVSTASEVQYSTDCEFEDDDFGDFEEASSSNIIESNVHKESLFEQNEFTRRTRQNSLAALPKLAELIEELNLRDLPNIEHDDRHEVDINICDLFRNFDFCDNQTNPGIEGFSLRSLKLWSRLCNVEETAALNFVWNDSIAYLNFLHFLQINMGKDGDNMASRLNNLADEMPSVSSGSSHSLNYLKNAEVSSEMIDSLSVPPVTFDWQTSGLSNPLTGSSMPAISAVLACDFFNGDGSQNSSCNGESILQKELDALGLGGTTDSSKINFSNNLHELMKKKESVNRTTISTNATNALPQSNNNSNNNNICSSIEHESTQNEQNTQTNLLEDRISSHEKEFKIIEEPKSGIQLRLTSTETQK